MATTYRIQFNNVEEQAIQCTITDSTGDLGTIDIEGAEDAIRIVSQDNDENKFSPIKAKKCVIKFLNSQSVNLRTFATGEDNKWSVEVTINSLTVFVGNLEQGDIEEPFQYEENQIVILTATDGLGILKTHTLEDVYNVWTTGPIAENRIIDYIAACLGVTGLRLHINVINNLREEDNDDTTDTSTYGNIYATLFLNIKTFEDGRAGRYVDCYQVLEKILGHDCYLTQAKGQWWIIRVKELRQDFNMTKTIFDFDGTALSFETLNYEHSIGLKDVLGTTLGTPDAIAFFSQDKTTVSIQRPVKSITLRYNYDIYSEIICNGAFERGAFIADLPDEVNADGMTLQAKSYDIDCWTYNKQDPPTTQDSTAYIKRLFRFGQEKERFVHMVATAVDSQYYLVCNEEIPVNLYDRFTISFAVRYSTDLGGATGEGEWFQAKVKLFADDGTFWTLNCVSGTASAFFDTAIYWKETASDFIGSVSLRLVGMAESIDFTQWQNLSFDSTPIPRSGKLQIILENQDVSSTRDKDFGAINFDYIPYIDGNYNTFSSQTDTSTRDGSYFASIDEEVYISNSPTPIFKGALLKFNGTDFVLAGRFYEGQEYDQTTGPDHLATYGELRVRAYHQQFRNGDEIYKATCQGLGGVIDPNGLDDHPDIIHRYFNRDIEPTTDNQAFQLVNQDVDLRNCEWTGTLIKNFDIGIGFVSDTYAFAYDGPNGPSGGGGGSGGGSAPGGRFGVSGEDDTAAENRAFDATGFDFSINNAVDVNLGGFGSGTHTGDPTRGLSVTSAGKVIETTQPPREIMYQFQQITPGTDPTIIGSGGVGDLTYFGIATLVPAFVSTGVYSFTFPSNLLLLGKTAVEVIGMDGGSPIFIIVDTSGTLGSDSNAFFVYLFNISGSPVDSANAYQMIIKVYY